MEEMKRCSECGESRPISRYRKVPKGVLRSVCMECDNRKRREKYNDDPDYRAKVNAQVREFNSRNPEYKKEYDQQPEVKAKNRQRVSEWAKNNPEKARENIRNWINTRPYYPLMYNINKRAKGNGKVTEWELEQLTNRSTNCPYCGDMIDDDNRHYDHIIPLASGGTSNIDNIQIICARCNRAKWDDESSALTDWFKRIILRAISK